LNIFSLFRKKNSGKNKSLPYPENWASELSASKDFFTLADTFNYYPGDKMKQDTAKQYLIRAGSEALDGIMKALSKEDWGKQPLSEILAEIGDPRAVPLLKQMIDRASYKGFYSPEVYEFVEKYPQMHNEEKLKCALCGKDDLTSQMRLFGRGENARAFCSATCWPERAEVLVHELGDCRFYQHGACALGGECSMLADSYLSCQVYQSAGGR
jgi:hypothetical protein